MFALDLDKFEYRQDELQISIDVLLKGDIP